VCTGLADSIPKGSSARNNTYISYAYACYQCAILMLMPKTAPLGRALVTNGTCPAVFTATWETVDACGNTNTCSQIVTTAPPISLTFGRAEWLPHVGVRLTLLGNATGSVAIQWTGEVTNTLSNWPTLIWFNNFSGSTQYIDSDATNFGTRFYRAVTP